MKKSIVILAAFCAAALGAASGNALAALKIQSWTLDNGARVAFVENHSIPILDVSVDFDAGARRDPAGKAGLAGMTNAMLARGIVAGGADSDSAAEPALSEAQILDGFADIAAQRGGGAEMDRAGVTVRTLSSAAERDRAVELTARLLAQPSFPEDFLQRDKARMIAGIREADTKPEAIAEKAFLAALYGSHPYAQRATEASIGAIGRDDLLAFHRAHYAANGAVIAMIGDVTRAQAEQIARRLTARLPQGAPLPAMPEVLIAPGSEQRIAHPASQSHILIGMPALERGDADFFALTVGNYILGGGGFDSRLTREVREKRGLTYSVYSGFNPMAQKGPFQIGLQTKREQTAQALQVVRDTLAAFLRDGPTPAELKAAKDNLVGGFSLRIDSNRKILANLALIAYYGLPADYLDTWTRNIGQVSIADIRAAFRRKIAQAQLHTVIVGDADGR
ncbi:insulinase family protein [Oxalobacteraceae bacterium CAVE-383]|nr:insulinase family protein [Oxalobacteraceae bacterium CAVE-383]